MEKKSYFQTLFDINCEDKIEKKGNLSYLSWAYAWGEVKKYFPLAFYTIYENSQGWNYFTDGNTCWVKTGVTIEGLEHIEYLPVMDARNISIKLDSVTSFDVNKAIQRSLTKACARHGLGLYVYAGEDLPEIERKTREQAAAEAAQKVLDDAVAQVNGCTTTEQVKQLFAQHKDLQSNPAFHQAVIARGTELKNNSLKNAKDNGTKTE